MTRPTVLAFAGSTRRESFNRRLLRAAVEAAEASGLGVDHVELSDYPIPIFNQDLEAEHGQDPHATRLRRKLQACDGLLLASPEYNGSVTPLMKNVIDWLSRSEEGGAGVEVYDGKKALLIGASPGRSGARSSIDHLRAVLERIGVEVMDSGFSLPRAGDAFDDSGNLRNDEQRRELAARVREFADRFATSDD